MTELPHKMDDDLVQRWSEAVTATLETLADWAAVSKALQGEDMTYRAVGSIGVVMLPDMIRIRVKPKHVTVRIGDTPKQRYASAIHALHVIRVAVVEQGAVIEDTPKTAQALNGCIARAQAELDAAIEDVSERTEPAPTAICVYREPENRSTASYYQTTDKRHLRVVESSWGTFVDNITDDNSRIRAFPEQISADDAIRRMGYVIAPVGG